jgi:hypothetical protein
MDHGKPFDKLDDLAGLREESLYVEDEEGKGEGVKAPEPPPLPKDAKSWDFRHGKMPEEVMVINDEGGEAHLEVQQDRSTALIVPPKSYLKFDRTPANALLNAN